MRWIIILLFFTIGGLKQICLAQQIPMFSQYMYNNFIYNPAIAGTKKYTPIMLDAREQWRGLDGHPRTQTISLHTPLAGNKLGIGIFLFNDKVGPVVRQGGGLAYAYHLKLNRMSKLAFGISGTFYSLKIKTEELKFDQDLNGDGVITSQGTRSMFPNVGAGVYYYHKKFYSGFSVPGLLEPKNGTTYAITEVKHYHFTAGGYIKLRPNYLLEPSILIKYVQAAPLNIDINAMFILYNRFHTGITYRHRAALVYIMGYSIQNKIHMAYSYDLATTHLTYYNTGTHEVTLGYNIFPKNKTKVCDAYEHRYTKKKTLFFY